jgi:hypothetical protein
MSMASVMGPLAGVAFFGFETGLGAEFFALGVIRSEL